MRLALILSIFFCGCIPTDFFADKRPKPIDVEAYKESAKESFTKAEKEIYKQPVDDTLRPHPDPKKCICKGTGIITHGDGHTTPCEYHAKNE